MSSSRSVAQQDAAAVGGRLAALLAAVIVCVRASPDPDLWGHVRFGLDLLSTHRLTAVDPYSFTQDVPWVNHEWLSELLFGLAYRAGGTIGLMALKCAVLGSAFWLLALVARSTHRQYGGWLLAVAFINLAPIAITFRPQLWTILGLCVVCYVLAGRVRLAWLPLTFALWANLHGGWIVGAGVMGLWIAGRVIDQRSLRNVVAPASALTVSVLATICNPYGWHLWEFLGRTVRLSRPDIIEWRPYWENFETAHGLLLPLALAVFLTTVIARRRHMTWAYTLPTLWLGVNGIFVSRLAPLFALVACVAELEAWADAGAAQPAAVASGPAPAPVKGRWVVDALAVLAISVPFAVNQGTCLAIPADWGPDLVAASALESPAVSGRLIVPFDWGEYALWRWGPRLKVSIDGRRETIYSEAVIHAQQALGQGRPEGIAFAAQVRPEYAWLHSDTDAPAVRWFAEHGYTVDVQTPKSVVVRRTDLPPLTVGVPRPNCAF